MSDREWRAAIAARLKEARERIFPTAAEAARALKMKPVTVRAHESGQNGVGPEDLDRYARRYGVAVAWLITGATSQEPVPGVYFSSTDTLTVYAQLQDGAWLPDDPKSWEYPRLLPRNEAGLVDMVHYDDPRFPDEMVTAYKVKSDRSQGEYPSGTIIFGVPRWQIGYRDGDHVIVVRSRNDFCEWTLRRVERKPGRTVLHALTSDSESFEYLDDAITDILAVVIGSVTRREVNQLSLDDRRGYEAELAAGTKASRRPSAL